jgi:hypothetical protein
MTWSGMPSWANRHIASIVVRQPEAPATARNSHSRGLSSSWIGLDCSGVTVTAPSRTRLAFRSRSAAVERPHVAASHLPGCVLGFQKRVHTVASLPSRSAHRCTRYCCTRRAIRLLNYGCAHACADIGSDGMPCHTHHRRTVSSHGVCVHASADFLW